MRIEPRTSPTPRPTPAPGLASESTGTRPLTPSPTAPLGAPDSLTITDAARPTTSSSLSDLVAKAKEAAAKQPEWTMAINLAASLGDQFGAVSKGQQLRDLAKETEGKPVTIVAQQVMHGEDGPVVERFVIKDGKVTSMGQTPSEGFAQDLEALTAMAATDHPARRMGVVIQSHGNASDGMSGDNGAAPLGELTQALRDGLANSGRSRLDVLNFDACLMGQQEVLSAVRGLADHVVASPEVELANGSMLGGKIDGQPTQEMLRALLATPEMDGEALARKSVELASQAARPFDVDEDGKADPDRAPMNATPTLAHYSMAKVEGMSQAVDGLGSALREALKDPKNREAIAEIISRTPRFSAASAEGEGVGLQQRDLKRFSEGLEAAIAQGKLADPSGKLKQAAKATLEALDALVTSYHGEEAGDNASGRPQNYREMGGLGVFMPSVEFLNGTPETLATPLEQITLNAEVFANQVKDPEMTANERSRAKEFFLRGAGGAMGEIWSRLPEAQQSAFTPLRDAYFALEKAETPAAIASAAKRFGEVAAKLQDGPMGRLITEQKTNERRELVAEAYALAEPHMTDGWRQFTAALRAAN